jgi:hypothetical protein
MCELFSFDELPESVPTQMLGMGQSMHCNLEESSLVNVEMVSNECGKQVI